MHGGRRGRKQVVDGGRKRGEKRVLMKIEGGEIVNRGRRS
jgi:hypothetical protein